MTTKEYLLICLSEECAEVAQRVSKGLRFTMEEVQPGQDLNNAERIAEELDDLLGVVQILRQVGALRWEDEAAIQAKRLKVARMIEYSTNQGVIE